MTNHQLPDTDTLAPTHSETILIVDDDCIEQEILRKILFQHGYRIAVASSGVEGVAQATALMPDLILLDVMMPGMDGFEVCRRLRADALLAEVPIIMVTALDDRDSRLRGIEAGADDFISKPFDRVELRARVRTIMRLNRYHRLLLERTRRQMAEEMMRRLQAERDQTRAILDALGEAVIVTGFDGTIQYFNPAAVALTGFTQAENQEKPSLTWQDRQQNVEYDRMQATVRSGQTWRGELVNRRKDGTLYDAALTVAPLFDPHIMQHPIGFVTVLRDITPLKEAERLKDQFVSNVSHELRTPLSIITLLSGNLDTLYTRLDETKRRSMICDIRRHARVLDDLIGDLLEIARIDHRRIADHRQQINLVQLAHEEIEKQMPLAEKKGLSMAITGVEQLPVCGNDRQLRQVIRNLVNNAIKYTPRDGHIHCQSSRLDSTPHIDEAAWPGSADLPAGNWAAWRVTDTGIGIHPENMPYIFDRFYRGETQGKIAGTGLGLSIARELVMLHTGQMSVASTLGKGSIFTIYLPLLEDQDSGCRDIDPDRR